VKGVLSGGGKKGASDGGGGTVRGLTRVRDLTLGRERRCKEPDEGKRTKRRKCSGKTIRIKSPFAAPIGGEAWKVPDERLGIGSAEPCCGLVSAGWPGLFL